MVLNGVSIRGDDAGVTEPNHIHHRDEPHPGPFSRSLVAVVVSYNRLSKLKIAIERLLQSSPVQLKAIIVIDNASTDGTTTWLESQEDDRVVALNMEKNVGGAGGFAAGMALARKRFDPDWMLLLDDDASPAPDALETFHATHPERWEALAAAVYYPDGKICEMNRPSQNPFWSFSVFLRTVIHGREGFHIRHDHYRQSERKPIDVTSFVGFFVSRAGVDLVGLPEAGLFLYGDDSIYTLTLSEKGGRIAFAPDIRFDHDCTTFSAGEGRFTPLWKAYYYHRNLLILYRRAAGLFFWPALGVIVPKWIFKVVRHKGGRVRYMVLLRHALRDGLLNRKNVSHETVLSWSGATKISSQ